MRRLRPILCALCLALLVPLLVHARRALPVDTAPLVAEKYAGWSGVLRLWVFEGWPCGAGSVSPWLSDCVARFERRHAGVYVQPTYVDAGALASMNDSGISRPDMILFPPGVLEAPTGLTPLAIPNNVREALASTGVGNGVAYAVPVALGGYAWAINTALLAELPASWHDIDSTMVAPEPEPWRRWDAALLALCAAQRPNTETAQSDDGPGLDFGLVPADTPAPTPTPTANATQPCRLPDGFAFDASAWRRFVNGEAAAVPVTQREVRRLQALSAQGKGPEWRLAGDCAFTDQLLSLAIPEKPDGDPRVPLCDAFIRWLLSDECQGELCRASAFGVTDAPSGYSPGDPLNRMDAALRSDGLVAPNAFDTAWPETASDIVRKTLAGEVDPGQSWAALVARLRQYPNIR